MEIRDIASVREAGQSEVRRVQVGIRQRLSGQWSVKVRLGDFKKPQVRGRRLGARQKRHDGGRRVKDRDRVGGEDSAAIGPEKGRDSHKGVRKGRIR
jgi:hypothetical protein